MRVLQEGQYERVGEEKTRQVDVRIIAATNRNLKKDIGKGRFRQDLYYRLSVFPIEVVPLRYRKGDIPLLAEHFLGLLQKKENRNMPRLSAASLKQLQSYDWPGNVRELQNIIERAVITSQRGRLHFILPDDAHFGDTAKASAYVSDNDNGKEVVPESEMKHRERQNIMAALKVSKWKVYGRGGAAELLGIKPTTLTSRMKK